MAEPVEVRCTINGSAHTAAVAPGTTLAEHLDRCGFPTNVGCGEGTCGTCLVRVDGRPVQSCLTLVATVDGSVVTTVHGLRGPDGGLTGAQTAISAEGGLQCGFCTPAFVLLLDEMSGSGAPPDPEALRERLSAVTCRCTGYAGLLRAARRVRCGPVATEPPRRREDSRLLTGRGDYLGARSVPGQLHARFVRAAHPHADVIAVDTAAATAMPGVAGVFTADDLPPSAVRFTTGDAPFPENTLATDQVRYTGQPVAVVVAATRDQAEDAARAVRVAYRPRGPHRSEVRRRFQDVGAVDRALAAAPVVVRRSFAVGRHTGMPMETRGLLAEPRDGGLVLHGLTKQVRANRDRVAAMLGLAPERVDVVPTDVGGAFGVKGEFYPEDVVVPLAALRLGRPVKWIEDRDEHLIATNHSREQAWEVTLAADTDGALLAARVDVVVDAGAYHRPLTDLMPAFATAMFPGPYRLPHYRADVTIRYSHKTPTGPYRAPGRFEVGFVRERALDLLAAELGLAPDELRWRNLLSPAELPHRPGTECEGVVEYDEGDCGSAFAAAVAAAERYRTAPAEPGVRRGAAAVPFVEKEGAGEAETATARLHPDGRVTVEVDSASSGQGHETTLAAVAAEVLAVPPQRVVVSAGRAAAGARGLGTFASRTALMTGNAVAAAASRLAEQVLAAVARRRGVPPGELRLAPRGGPGAVSPVEVAGSLSAEDRTATATFRPGGHSYPSGAVAVAVDVDIATLRTRVRHVHVFCDVGRVLDEVVVRGQIVGGVVQGVGGAVMENLPYSDSGHPLVRRLADYPVPLAADAPDVEISLAAGRASGNPLGVRGVGELGTAPIGGAVAAAVADAVPEIAAEIVELPLTPSTMHGSWVRSGAPDLAGAVAREAVP
ncbi:molybdopterin-dependent oxidoreductase [Saccharopolyspora rosea]|uniref:molybdopterin-dependent oxidoreductase n=1 Tax=Saccharopolyspora rosea TaxID=524884 RepID=UPI0031E5F4A4